jgi:hypothetical protein
MIYIFLSSFVARCIGNQWQWPKTMVLPDHHLGLSQFPPRKS